MIGHNWNPFLRFPRASLVLTGLLCLPLLLRLAGFEVSSETRVLLEGDQRNLSSYEKVKQILADVEVVVISLECPEVFSRSGIDAVRRVSETFQQLPGVADVKSLTHSVKPVRRGFSFEMVPLIPPDPLSDAEMAQLKKAYLEHALIRNVMVAADSRHTLITVTYRNDPASRTSPEVMRRQVESTLASFTQEGLRFQVLGLPLIEDEIRSTLLRDIQRFLPAAVLVLVLILWWTFRSLRALALVLANQLVLLLILPGVISFSGFHLNVYSIMLFPLLTGIHLAQLAHVYGALQEAVRAGQTTEPALAFMLHTAFKSCLFSLITTLIGLLSLTISDVRQIQEFGLLGALGVALIFFMTFGPGLALAKIACPHGWFGPTASALVPPPWPIPGNPRDWSDWATDAVQRYRLLIIGLAGLLILINIVGVRLVRTDIRAVEFLNSRSPTRLAVEELDKIYGGINVVQIEIDSGATNGINQLAFLQYVEQIQRYAETRPDISAAYSYAQLLALMNQIWDGGGAEAMRLPRNPWLTQLFVLALKSQNYPFLTALSDRDFRTAYLVVRTRDMASELYLEAIHDIVAYAQHTKPATVVVSAAQGIHSILEADRRIMRSQLHSAGLTSIVIGAVLTILWRSPVLAFLSFITNAIPVALVVAIAGFANVPLNSITIMVAAICLGIVVDDSIHFITHWRDERRSGLTPLEAVRKTFRSKGRPIVFTSIILIAVFTVFWCSSFPPVVHFGLLSAIAFVGALLTVLFFLPAMLTLRNRR